MSRREDITSNLDWLTVLLFFLIAVLGWMNIFAAVYDESAQQSIFDMSLDSGRQLFFLGSSIVLIIVIMVVDFKFFDSVGYIIYGLIIGLLIFVLLFGREVAGSKSWFEIGPMRLQPSEFAKFATALALAKYMSGSGFKVDRLSKQVVLFAIISLPAILIILQGDTGTALVYSIFILVFFREGMSPTLLILGVASAIIFILTLLVTNHLYLYLGIVVIVAIDIWLIKKRTLKKVGFKVPISSFVL